MAERDYGGWFGLLSPPCGYCLKASMTAARSIHPVDSRLRGNDGKFCKGLLMGEESKEKGESNDRVRWLD